MLFAKDFRRIAKERLASYWLPNIGFLLLYMLLNGATGATVVGWILLAGPVEYGFYSYYLEQVRGLHPTVGTMFDAFSTCFGTSIALFLLKGIFTFYGRCCFSSPVSSKATAIRWRPISCTTAPRWMHSKHWITAGL